MKRFIIINLDGSRVAGTPSYSDHLDAFLALSYLRDADKLTVLDVTDEENPKFWSDGRWIRL